MSTIANSRDKQTLKYLKIIEEKKLSERIVAKLSIGSLAFSMRPIDFPYPPHDDFGFFNTA